MKTENTEKRSHFKNRSFVKMAAILAMAGILVRVIGFLYRLPLTNMIGDEGNGIYAAGYNIYNFFLIMSSAGLPVAISRMVAEKLALEEYSNAKRIFKVSLFMAGGLSLFFCALMFFGTYGFKIWCERNGHEDYLMYKSVYCLFSLSPTIFIVGLMAVFRGYFQGFQTTVPTSVSQVVEQVFNAVFSVLLAWLWMKFGVEYGAAGGTAGTGVGALFGLVCLVVFFFSTRESRRKIYEEDKKKYTLESAGTITKNLVKIAVPIITGTAIFSMTNFVDMAMVESRLAAAGFDPDTITKLYGQLNGKYVTISTMPVSISTAIATAVIPSIALSLARKEKEVVRTKVDTALRVTMIVSIPAACGLGVLGSPILKMLFPRHSEGGSLITAGALSVVFLALSQISTGVLQGIGEVKKPAFNALWGALIKIPCNFIFIAIPSINIIGAIISTTVCYALCSFLNFKALVKATKVRPDYKGMLLKPSIAGVVMSGVCFGIYKLSAFLTSSLSDSVSNALSTVVAILVAVFVYFATMIVIRGFTREDLAMMPMGRRITALVEKIGRI